MPRAGVEHAVGTAGDTPDHRLIGRKQRLDAGRQRQLAIAAERHTLKAAAHKILVCVQLPGCGTACPGTRAQRRQQNNSLHSFTSTWIVLDPEITMSPMPISSSAILELRVCEMVPRLGCEPASTSDTEGGGSGKSSPSS